MQIDSFTTFNVAIVVLAAGKWLNQRFAILRDYNIPEPVGSGLLVCVLLALVHAVTGVEIAFNLETRDFLLLYFFASIGLNADLRTLISGGRPLLVLLSLTVGYITLQNLVGTGVASLLGLDPLVGLLGGSVSMLGGHGTAIAWAPRFVERHGIANAPEIGIACATFGLVLASLMGGPIARLLIHRHRLRPAQEQNRSMEAAADPAAQQEPVRDLSLLGTLFWLNMSLVVGEALFQGLRSVGGHLPLFVCCLFAAILITNSVPRLVPIRWPSRTTSLALIADIALGLFLAMSLMSLQLWTIVDLAGPILAILAAQALAVFGFTVLLVYRAMGGGYDAAVISAGFAGFSLGATPTAMANMAAVTATYGPAPQAFIIVPLVSGFFVDISNSLIIQRFLEALS